MLLLVHMQNQQQHESHGLHTHCVSGFLWVGIKRMDLYLHSQALKLLRKVFLACAVSIDCTGTMFFLFFCQQQHRAEKGLGNHVKYSIFDSKPQHIDDGCCYDPK